MCPYHHHIHIPQLVVPPLWVGGSVLYKQWNGGIVEWNFSKVNYQILHPNKAKGSLFAHFMPHYTDHIYTSNVLGEISSYPHSSS